MEMSLSRKHISVIAALALALAGPPCSVTALSSVNGAISNQHNNIIAITHAAGRMGKTLALQLREDAELRRRRSEEAESADEPLDLPMIRAIVRSKEEAFSVRCDLGGMTTASGKAQPNDVDWLETVVVESPDDGDALRNAFEGARAAALCDASHNELIWRDANDCEINEDGVEECTGSGGFSIVVPAMENRDLSPRLLAEIDAASKSSTLRHVVLRSTMGLASDPNGVYASAMGGEMALSGPRQAETAFRAMAALEDTTDTPKRGRRHTVLRLGALTDDAGMVPLAFGIDDSILVKTTDDGTENRRPPILSRSDAARLSTFLLREDSKENDNTTSFSIMDCAWHPKYGRESVGREETVFAAARQDLDKAILETRRMKNATE